MIIDYLLLTKRFAIVAASQLPIHYLLSAKSPLNPIQRLLRLSHEELNVYHRLLGRIVLIFVLTHAGLYLNFYIQKDLLFKRIKDIDVQLGLLAATSLTILGTTAISFVRSYSYRHQPPSDPLFPRRSYPDLYPRDGNHLPPFRTLPPFEDQTCVCDRLFNRGHQSDLPFHSHSSEDCSSTILPSRPACIYIPLQPNVEAASLHKEPILNRQSPVHRP